MNLGKLWNMNSPFPGMDPYLEAHWRDVHHALITYARDQIQSQLPAGLLARMEERVFVEPEEGEGRVVYPEVRVVERGKFPPAGRMPASSATAVEPLVIPFMSEPATQGYLQIIDLGTGHRVITVIEFLSPTNKIPGEGQELYLKKQRECRESRVNLVEIDLTRAGKQKLLIPMERIPPSHRTTYQVCVWRGWKPETIEVYPVPLQKSLPIIRIPLRETDGDISLDLQALIEQCYQNGRYGEDLDYHSDPVPPLLPDEAEWASKLLRSKSLR